MPIAAIYGPVNEQCLMRSVGYPPSCVFTGHNVKLLFGDFIAYVSYLLKKDKATCV